MTANKKIPALRFKEFKGEWEEKILGDIATFAKGKGISKSEISAKGKFECIRYGELYTHYNELIKDIISKTNLDKNELIFSEYNDVIIPGSGETQLDIATASCVLKEGVALGGDLNIIKTENNGLFLAYYLNNPKKKDIAVLAQGNSVVHLYASQLKTLKVNLPKKEEQQKIAAFLTAVDGKIQQLTKKKALLEQYKKGVMQQIFTKQIRFKDDDGNDYPDWEEKELGKASIINPKSENLPNSFVYIDLESVENGILLKEQRIILQDAPGRAQRLLEIDDILFQMVRPYQKNNLFFQKEGEYVASTGYAQIRVKTNAKYLYHYLHLDSFVTEVLLRCTGTSYPAISSGDLAKIKIQFPAKEEQQKIANFLTGIDNKINAVGRQLQQTQVYKKGLLQQIFV